MLECIAFSRHNSVLSCITQYMNIAIMFVLQIIIHEWCFSIVSEPDPLMQSMHALC